MPKQYKLQKVAPFVRPVPEMPDPVVLALGWLNAQAAEGWVRPDLTVTVDGETVTLGPSMELGGETHILLEGDGTPYEYKLQKLQPFVRPVPEMPAPLELAMTWINKQAEAGWELAPFCLNYSEDPETVTIDFADTVDVRGDAQLLLRRPKTDA